MVRRDPAEPDLRFCRVCREVVVRARSHGRTVYLTPVPAGTGDFVLAADDRGKPRLARLLMGRGYYVQHEARCTDPVRFAGMTRPTRRRRPR